MTTYRTETLVETVVCGGCGEHVLRAETTFAAEGTLACRRCDAHARVEAAAPRPPVEKAVRPIAHRSWTDFVLGALVPVPLYVMLSVVLLAVLRVMSHPDETLAALAGGAVLWVIAVLALGVTARFRLGRPSFANGLAVSAVVAFVLGGTFAFLAMGAMAGAIRG